MKPRKNYRSRPKKHGAKRKQRVLSQKKRLISAGCKEEEVEKLNVVEIREMLKETMKKNAKAARIEKKKTAAGKTPKKKPVKSEKTAAKE